MNPEELIQLIASGDEDTKTIHRQRLGTLQTGNTVAKSHFQHTEGLKK